MAGWLPSRTLGLPTVISAFAIAGRTSQKRSRSLPLCKVGTTLKGHIGYVAGVADDEQT